MISEMVLAYLEGKLELEDFRPRLREFTGAHHRLHETWKTVSLDAPLYDDSGLSRVDVLDSEVEHF